MAHLLRSPQGSLEQDVDVGPKFALSCFVLVQGENQKWLVVRCLVLQIGRAFFKSFSPTSDFHFTVYFRRLWNLCLWNLFPTFHVTWVIAAGMMLFLPRWKIRLGWAGAYGKLGQVEKPGKQD